MISSDALIAYHGCDITTRDDLVSGRVGTLDHSDNSYDWLGPGAYFFEGDLQRATLFANTAHATPTRYYTARPIATPAVVGAILRADRWLDMTTQSGIADFALAWKNYLDGRTAADGPAPRNRRANKDDQDVIVRELDRRIFVYLHTAREILNLPPYQAVRAAFPQGDPVLPDSGFRRNTHIQIAVRDDSCIEGWFLPKGQTLLTEAAYAEKRLQLAAAVAALPKRRTRTSL